MVCNDQYIGALSNNIIEGLKLPQCSNCTIKAQRRGRPKFWDNPSNENW